MDIMTEKMVGRYLNYSLYAEINIAIATPLAVSAVNRD